MKQHTKTQLENVLTKKSLHKQINFLIGLYVSMSSETIRG